MSNKVKNELVLDSEVTRKIEERISSLLEEGIEVYSAPSGELNFSGCHRGYCQAWD